MQKLIMAILDNEEVLMEKILEYAKKQNYVRYTSTLKEAWRMSIAGLSAALIKVIQKSNDIPQMGPDDDFTTDEVAEFGILEAQKHRSRGVTIGMFLGLMKYYQQAYIDLVNESEFSIEEKQYFCQYIKRYFDHVELGFTIEWAGLSEKNKLQELQDMNRELTNEKNKYLTIFESIYDPIILVDKDNIIENINHKAAEVFLNVIVPGTKYYSNTNIDKILNSLKEELISFVRSEKTEISIEKTMETKCGLKTFIIKLKKMLDVSQKFEGTVILFNDITERIQIERKLKNYQDKLEYYAFTDSMTGVSNRRTGIMMLEKELSLVQTSDKPLSVAYLDVDGLKIVNDTYGHIEGDALIQFIVTSIQSVLRDIDIVSRMGGDEFIIIFPGFDEATANLVLQEICNQLEDYNQGGLKPYKHSFSYGIIEIRKDNKLSTNDVIKIADQKMYEKKLLKKQQNNNNSVILGASTSHMIRVK